MGQPYVGEIRMFGGNYAPEGWQFCNGALLAISENETLFQLIGTTYGGDGQSTFAVPNLQGRAPVHMGGTQGVGSALAETGGVETVTLLTGQMPTHSHHMLASADVAQSRDPASLMFGRASAEAYASEYAGAALSAQSIAAAGGSQPHNNMQPYLCITFIISLFGIFPSPT